MVRTRTGSQRLRQGPQHPRPALSDGPVNHLLPADADPGLRDLQSGVGAEPETRQE